MPVRPHSPAWPPLQAGASSALLLAPSALDTDAQADRELEGELAFARAQFDTLAATGSAHKTRDLAQRLWRLQRRIDDLEGQLAQPTAA